MNQVKETEFVREFCFPSQAEGRKTIKLLSFYLYETLYSYTLKVLNTCISTQIPLTQTSLTLLLSPCQTSLTQSNCLMSLISNLCAESVHFYS